MYLILNHAERIVDISEEARYVKRQANGVVIGCAKADADAIYSANTDCFYPLEPTGYIGDGHTLVNVETIPDEVAAGFYFYHAGEFYSTDEELQKLAQAKAESDLVPLASLVFVHLAENEAFDATTLTEHSSFFETYVAGIPYNAGRIRLDPSTGMLYKCITSHDAEHATDKSLAKNNLWERIADPADEWPEWFAATGVFDQWMNGDKCTHNGKKYISTVDNNVWEPGTTNAPWTEVEG